MKNFPSFLRPISLMLDKDWVERHNTRLLIGISMLAVLIIVAVFVFYAGQFPFAGNGSRWDIATNLVNGQGYVGCSRDYFPFCGQTNQITAMREPIPVLLMAAAMLVYPSQHSGIIVLGLLYLGTAWVIYTILKNYDHRIAVMATLLWVISVPVMREIGDDSAALAAAFFFSVGIFFFQKGRREQLTRYWIFSGIFLGMAALSRTVLLGVSIGLGLGLLYEQLKTISHDWRARIRPALLFLVSVSLIVAPWVVRNDLAFGTPVIGSTLTGYNIFRMNFIIASSNFLPHYVGSTEGYQALMNLIQQSNLSGTENEVQMQALYMQTGLQIILQHPLQYLVLSIYRFLPLWFDVSVKAAYGESLGLMDYLAMIQQTILLVAVLLGVSRNRKENWPFTLSLVLGCGAYMAIGAQLRYLVDLMPAVIILAASALPNLKFLLKHSPP